MSSRFGAGTMIRKAPLTRTARMAAALLAVVCLAAGGFVAIVAIERQSLTLAIASLFGLAMGALYLAAAWRGRPLDLFRFRQGR